ncbi:galactonate dehydratase [Aquiluna sp. Uisw_065]|uniref:galactonate dehydratase n=1 Tax=Aquiluna sp. Uisw_065 TaxID=3230967 RepID=UPI0039E7F1B0
MESFPLAPRWVFVRIETSDGLVGWGEASLEGFADVVSRAVEQFGDYLIGKDPNQIEDHWQVLSKGQFYRGGAVLASAVSGIDQALWDLLGKRLSVPVYQLLGGAVRKKIRAYGWIGGDDPSEVAEHAAEQIQAGLTAVKMNASGKMSKNGRASELSEVVRRVSAVRDVLGGDKDVAIDLHGRFDLATARRLAPLVEEFHPFFLEEPVVPENSHMLQHIVASTNIPIAVGERLYSRQEFLPVLQAGVAIVQPDVAHSGGISELRRIATLAEAYDALLAPHSPLGPLALAACLQVGFASPNHLIQEQSIGIHYNQGTDVLDYLVDTSPLTFVNGHFPLLQGPGLGIEIDEKAVREASKNWGGWSNPIWRHDDGSFAEW